MNTQQTCYALLFIHIGFDFVKSFKSCISAKYSKFYNLIRKEGSFMDYVICNPAKTVFIRLNNGKPETCVKQCMQRFTYDKAKNISSNLPKSLKKFHFKVDSIPEIDDGSTEIAGVKVICSIVDKSLEMKNWEQKISYCESVAEEAIARKEELCRLLSNVDKKLCNIYHEIELEPWKSGSAGYICYKKIKLAREERRRIKDELAVVSRILDCGLDTFAKSRTSEVIDGLQNRKYTYRDVFDD